MKNSILFLLVFISTMGLSQGKQEESQKGIKASATFSINSNGFAPIPAFSLDKPAFLSSATLVKGRFSYDPTLAYSLEMKPWFIDNWFHFKFIDNSEFELKGGVNFSTFCSGFKINDEEILKAERYFAFSLAGTYKLSPVSTLTLDYWSDNGQEKGSLSGHFISLVYDRSEIGIGEKALVSVNLMLFYINYTDRNDGLFVSPKISLSMNNIPVTLFLQANQAIQSNISPWPGFKWNIGISYNL